MATSIEAVSRLVRLVIVVTRIDAVGRQVGVQSRAYIESRWHFAVDHSTTQKLGCPVRDVRSVVL